MLRFETTAGETTSTGDRIGTSLDKLLTAAPECYYAPVGKQLMGEQGGLVVVSGEGDLLAEP